MSNTISNALQNALAELDAEDIFAVMLNSLSFPYERE